MIPEPPLRSVKAASKRMEEETMRTLVALGLTALAVAVALVAALPAAAGGQEVIRTGSCSGSADWKLKLKLDDGRIEFTIGVEYE